MITVDYTERDRELDILYKRIEILRRIINEEGVFVLRVEKDGKKRCEGLEKDLIEGLKHLHDFLVMQFNRMMSNPHFDSSMSPFPKEMVFYKPTEHVSKSIELFSKIIFGGQLKLTKKGINLKVNGSSSLGF